MTLGKDGRMLSEYQSKRWMDRIAKKRKYKNVPRGEKSVVSKLQEGHVLFIRSFQDMTRFRSEWIGSSFGISPRYVYLLRQKNPLGKWKKWAHLKGKL